MSARFCYAGTAKHPFPRALAAELMVAVAGGCGSMDTAQKKQ